MVSLAASMGNAVEVTTQVLGLRAVTPISGVQERVALVVSVTVTSTVPVKDGDRVNVIVPVCDGSADAVEVGEAVGKRLFESDRVAVGFHVSVAAGRMVRLTLRVVAASALKVPAAVGSEGDNEKDAEGK